jgi:hypothetical protein
MFKKILLAIIIILILLLAGSYFLDFSPKKVSWGVSFSPYYASNELGLNWHETYLAILDDLKVDHIRLSAYWNATEIRKDVYDFTDLDYQVNLASQRNIQIVLAIGRRLPRWPECHDPLWIKGFSTDQINTQKMAYLEAVIKHYQGNKNVIAWQVENEPYLSTFGVCPALDKTSFKDEIALVKRLDGRPVIVTDSGELSTWFSAANSGGDILGNTLYRVVYNDYIGYFHWPIPPAFYTAKVALIKMFSPIKRVIVAELQTEAWHGKNTSLKATSMADDAKSLSPKQMADNTKFAQQAGYDEIYLWGPEWWYFMKTQKNQPEYWNEAKKLWANNK